MWSRATLSFPSNVWGHLLRLTKCWIWLPPNFDCSRTNIIIQTTIHHHLKYAVQFRSSHLINDTGKIKKVQQRVTKLIPSLCNKPHQDRLTNLGLYLLEAKILRSHLIVGFKILDGYDNVNLSFFLGQQKLQRATCVHASIKGFYFSIFF